LQMASNAVMFGILQERSQIILIKLWCHPRLKQGSVNYNHVHGETRKKQDFPAAPCLKNVKSGLNLLHVCYTLPKEK